MENEMMMNVEMNEDINAVLNRNGLELVCCEEYPQTLFFAKYKNEDKILVGNCSRDYFVVPVGVEEVIWLVGALDDFPSYQKRYEDCL